MNVERYHARLRLLPCVACVILGLGPTRPVEIHHLGPPEARNDWMVCPLCDYHHEGPGGVHGLRRRVFARDTRLDDLHLLRMTLYLFVMELP